MVYSFGGLPIECEWPLPGLPAAPLTDPALSIIESCRPLSSAEPAQYRWRGRYDLSLYRTEAGLVFHSAAAESQFGIVPESRVIRCYPGPRGWGDEVADVLVRRILPRVAQLYGRHVLHGSAVATPAGAILLVGRSCSGKSTLAVALAAGCEGVLLGDDAAILHEDGGRFFVCASASSPCLWPDSAAVLAPWVGRPRPLRLYEGKLVCPAPAEERPDKQELRAIYILQPGDTDAPVLAGEPFRGAERLLALLRHRIRLDPSDARATAATVAFLADVVESCPPRALHIRHNFDELPALVECVLSDQTRRGKPEP